MNTTSSPQNMQAFEFKEKILTLQSLIHTAHPTMPTLLRQIHTQLRTDEELATLLSDEEIGVVVSGLSRQAAVVISEQATKASAAKNAGLKKKLSGPNAFDLF